MCNALQIWEDFVAIKEKSRRSSPFTRAAAKSGCNVTKWSFNHDISSKAILFPLAETSPLR
jgi:hypothetical protein